MIRVRDRRTGALFEEQVYGQEALDWVYGSKLGRLLEEKLLSKKWISSMMGVAQNSRQSAKRIPRFIEQYSIRMDEFEKGPFQSFNDFFIRQFLPGARPFSPEPSLAAFAEARYFAWSETSEQTQIPVKGTRLAPKALCGAALDTETLQKFEGGPLLLARLCPTDYHRFHFPDSGQWLQSQRVPGRLRSVNPLALEAFPKTFLENERQVSILSCNSLGLLAFIEVGALGVGKIIQSRSPGEHFSRGEEKGYFIFGGSTVIVLGEKGRWKPDTDLIENTNQGIETLIRLGEQIGR